MSIADRMKSKQAAIMAQAKAPASTEAPKVPVAPRSASGGPLTAPGGMAVFRQEMLKHESTVQALESELSQYRDGVRTIRLDTALISPSRWANRHALSFEGKAFESFKEEIENSNGNIQPILVRPVGDRYEVVFGHRRFTACQQLEIQVLAMVMELSDLELFAMMDRENRLREDLSPFEQGEMWRKALDDGLYSSARQLSLAIGVSAAHVGRCITIARLPKYVLDLFKNPTEIQVRWALALQDLLQADPEALPARAKKLAPLASALPSARVFEMLMATESTDKKAKPIPLKKDGKTVGRISRGPEGEVSISVERGQLSEHAFKKLHAALEALIGQ